MTPPPMIVSRPANTHAPQVSARQRLPLPATSLIFTRHPARKPLSLDGLSRCCDLPRVCEYVRTRRKLKENLQAVALQEIHNGPVSVVNSAVVSM
jgi:hypothetical protein